MPLLGYAVCRLDKNKVVVSADCHKLANTLFDAQYYVVLITTNWSDSAFGFNIIHL